MASFLLLAQLLTSLTQPPMGCPTPTAQPLIQTITIPKPEFPEAQKRAMLSQLLIDSLRDEGKGIFNLKREREIKKLAKQLSK